MDEPKCFLSSICMMISWGEGLLQRLANIFLSNSTMEDVGLRCPISGMDSDQEYFLSLPIEVRDGKSGFLFQKSSYKRNPAIMFQPFLPPNQLCCIRVSPLLS